MVQGQANQVNSNPEIRTCLEPDTLTLTLMLTRGQRVDMTTPRPARSGAPCSA